MSDARVATLVVLKNAALDITSVAVDHVALDTSKRKLLLPGDVDYPSELQIEGWRLPAEAVAVVLTPGGRLSAVLDVERARNGAWIEDGFVRALRD
jgi:hypothetical protein